MLQILFQEMSINLFVKIYFNSWRVGPCIMKEDTQISLYINETEYFGFHPTQVLGELYEDVFNCISETLFSIHIEIKKLLPETQIKLLMEEYSTHIEGVCERSMEIFETYTMRNIFTLPKEVFSRETEIECVSNEAAFKRMASDTNILLRRLQTCLCMNDLLEKERFELREEAKFLDNVSVFLGSLAPLLNRTPKMEEITNSFSSLKTEIEKSINGYKKLECTRKRGKSTFRQESDLIPIKENNLLEQRSIENLNTIAELSVICEKIEELKERKI